MGVEAMDWDSVAKKEHLDTLTMAVRKLEETAKYAHSQVLALKKQEQAMRDLNGMVQTVCLLLQLSGLKRSTWVQTLTYNLFIKYF